MNQVFLLPMAVPLRLEKVLTQLLGRPTGTVPWGIALYAPPLLQRTSIDGVKAEYPDYFRLLKPLLRPGGLLVADNILGSSWTIDQLDDPTRNTVDRFNRLVAADPDFETAGVPIRQGIMIARKIR